MWSVMVSPQSFVHRFTRVLTCGRIALFAATALIAGCNGLNTSDNSSSSSSQSPDNLYYDFNPAHYPVGLAISTNTLHSNVSLTSLSISPALPAGLAFNAASGAITGTPTTITAAQTYTVKATNANGTDYVQLSLAITQVPPTMTYGGSTTVVTTVGNAVSITPTLGGGPVSSCTSTPALPAGLSLSNSCVISGTPTTPTAQAVYQISANNSGGSAVLNFTFTIKDIAPAISTGGPYTLYRAVTIAPISVTNTGGAVTTCSVSPTLPAGLTLSNTCTITGTPTTNTANTTYTLTANNSSGTPSTASFQLAVVESPPSISYSPNSVTYVKGTAISTLTPTSSGGTITTCGSVPALPAGLSISNTTCAISGTPTVVSAMTTYTISATNSTSTTTASLTITVNDVAPGISYTGSPYVFTKGVSVGTISAVNSGGAITNCSATPALPAGLAISSTCQITGTPTAITAAQSYSITATNSSGTPSSTTINITVNDVTPNLTYAGTPYTFTKGTSVGTITPNNTGGPAATCTVNPALPAGLSLSSLCKITGTPTAVVAAANYTITATNTGGTNTVVISIAVNDVLPNFSYAGTPYSFTRNSAIATQTPTNTGGAITSCSASPTLPAGLSLSNTCVLSGTPSVAQAATTYTITGTNSAGTASTSISIAVAEIVPVISYVGSPYTFTLNQAITSQTPNNTGGAATGCSSSPALPAGLSISSACVISGTPTATSAATTYTITATNAAGSGTTSISITVNATGPAINYIPTSYNFTYTKGTAIAALTPNNTGGAITSCAASPTLPPGLSINSTTCSITGTPTAVSVATGYTITASNSGGTSSAVITITVNDTVPVISYAGSPYTFTINQVIASQTPTNTGGAITSCTISPSLPAGLSLSSTCVLSGAPTAISSAANYTITASNSGGSGSTVISIAVIDVPPTLTYSPTSYTYTIGVAIAAVNPTLGGGAVVSCASSPSLPAGLTLSSGCVITGTPTAVVASQAYTITATNSGGSASKALTIVVNNGPPIISYSGGPYTLYRSSQMSTLTPTNTGGAITSCSSSPALPAGLSLSGTCAVSGAPTTMSAATNYTITATNAVGSNTAVINITVKDQAPLISYNPASYVGKLRVAISTISAVSSGGTPTACSSSPALPAGLSISATTCNITGTSTVVSAATSYTITATNATGSSSTTITIQIKDQPHILFYGTTDLSGVWNGTAPSSQNIWKVSADGADLMALTGNSNASLNSFNPEFTPDGTKVLMNSFRATTGANNGTATSSANIWTENANATSPSGLTANTNPSLDSDDPPRFSLDGTKVVFASKMALSGAANGVATLSYNIWIMNADGTGKVALTQNTLTGYDSVQPVFAPGNTVIYFASKQDPTGWNGLSSTSSYNIFKVNSDGTGLTRLTSETTGTVRDNKAPAVSPDGSTVVYESKSKVGSVTPGYFNIWTMTSAGANQLPLTSNTSGTQDSINPVFSPDGTEILFASKMNVSGSASSSYNIWKMAASGASQVALTQNLTAGYDSITPAWTSDNLQVVFSSLMNISGVTPASKNIWIMNSDGTAARNLTSNTAAGLDSLLGPGRVYYAP